jgi:hypothetical protein
MIYCKKMSSIYINFYEKNKTFINNNVNGFSVFLRAG